MKPPNNTIILNYGPLDEIDDSRTAKNGDFTNFDGRVNKDKRKKKKYKKSCNNERGSSYNSRNQDKLDREGVEVEILHKRITTGSCPVVPVNAETFV